MIQCNKLRKRGVCVKVAGIVAEYNPFHNGHKFHIEETRKQGATHIVAVMSPNFVQRGDVALFEKRIRTAVALKNGVDLVLELPSPYALGNAETFARGAVGIIKATGCVDMLSFGSESADEKLLKKAVEALNSNSCDHLIKKHLEEGNSFVKSRSLAIEEMFGTDVGKILSNPNDTLAVEYIKNLLDSDIEICTVKREGVSHDADESNGRFASASYIRNCILTQSNIIPQNFLPCNALEDYKHEIYEKNAVFDVNNLFKVLLFKLRTMTPEQIASLPDVSEGIENKIKKAAANANNFEELLTEIKSKRYTMARIRRIICCALNDITAEITANNPPYIRVLGFNERGAEVLSRMKKTASLPVSVSLSALEKENEICKIFAQTEARCTDNFFLASSLSVPAGFDYIQKPVIQNVNE